MLTTMDKAIVSLIMALLVIAEQLWDFSLGIGEEYVTMIIAILSPLLVWLVPNRPG